MTIASRNAVSQSDLSAAFIARVSAIIEKATGVQLGRKQEAMVRSRLAKRAMELNLGSPSNYADYFEGNQEQEHQALISLLTTHHTFFFREFSHFEYLERELLPVILPIVQARPDKTLRIWSAACSRGQEAYSLAMFFHSVLPGLASDVKFQILGTDVDPESVAIAENAVYQRQEIREVPLRYLAQHWAKGKGEIAEFVKAKKSLTQECKFKVLNLFAPLSAYPQEKFDIIFCRNVFIYFTPAQITEIMHKFEKTMQPSSHIFLGLSESLNGMNLKFQSVGPSVYSWPKSSESKVIAFPRKEQVAVATPVKRHPLRVFSIDDSATIHVLLKQILSQGDEFEIVGTALNGREASEKLSKLQVDIITLDIHMPELNGIDYLRKNFKKGHPPVVMVSSVSREEGDLAYLALELGASDYVEKPALANLKERGDEIRVKLKAAFAASTLNEKTNIALDRSLVKRTEIADKNSVAIFVVGTMSQRKKWEAFLQEMGTERPPVYFFVEGAESGLTAFAKELSKKIKVGVLSETLKPLRAGEAAIGDFKAGFASAFKKSGYKKVAICAFHGLSNGAHREILKQGGVSLFVEDLGGGSNHPLKDAANDYVPATSFAYLCWQALAAG